MHMKPKRQRANSYEYFGQNILDKEDDNDSDNELQDNSNIQITKRAERSDTLDMIQMVHGQLPSALIPPTSLHLNNIDLNGV